MTVTVFENVFANVSEAIVSWNDDKNKDEVLEKTANPCGLPCAKELAPHSTEEL